MILSVEGTNQKFIRQCQRHVALELHVQIQCGCNSFNIKNKIVRRHRTRDSPYTKQQSQIINLITLECYVHVVQQYNGLKLELKRFHRAAQDYCQLQINGHSNNNKSTKNFRDHAVVSRNG